MKECTINYPKKINLQQDAPQVPLWPYEFFFDAPTAGDAVSLSESLRQLGYRVYESNAAIETLPFFVSGATPRMDSSLRVTIAWYEAMCELACLHNCSFNGYSSLCIEPDDDRAAFPDFGMIHTEKGLGPQAVM